MIPSDLHAARRALGLTAKQIAAMLEIAPQSWYRWTCNPASTAHENMPRRAARLLRAYLDGYRPPDWPIPMPAATGKILLAVDTNSVLIHANAGGGGKIGSGGSDPGPIKIIPPKS